MTAKAVVFISGAGSNLQAILDADLPMQVVLVVSNNPEAKGLQRAERAGVPTWVLDHRLFAKREDYDQALLDKIFPLQPDWVILAGFMRRLTPVFVDAFAGKLVNIHPSLLPKYPGLHTYQRALDAGDQEVGSTVHLVTQEVDAGPILAQQTVPVEAGDTVESLKQKVQALEHELYPRVIGELLTSPEKFQKNPAR